MDEKEYRRQYYLKNRDAAIQYGRAYRRANRERIRATKKAYNKRHRTEISEKNRVYRQNNKQKIKCHRTMWRAIKAGELVVGNCANPDCSATPANSHIEGHHEDYSKPLDVVWFCMSCHQRWHRSGPVFRKGCMTSKKLQELLA